MVSGPSDSRSSLSATQRRRPGRRRRRAGTRRARSSIRRSSQRRSASLDAGDPPLRVERHPPRARQQPRAQPLGLAPPAPAPRRAGSARPPPRPRAARRGGRRAPRRARPGASCGGRSRPDAGELQPRGARGPRLSRPRRGRAAPARSARAPWGGCRTTPACPPAGRAPRGFARPAPAAAPIAACGSPASCQAAPLGLALVGAADPVRQRARWRAPITAAVGRGDRQPPHHQVAARRRPRSGAAEAGAPADDREDQQARRDRQRRAPGRALQHVAPLDVGQLVGDHHPHLVARGSRAAACRRGRCGGCRRAPTRRRWPRSCACWRR